MKIAVFGLGYVGCVSAACLADLGHEVCGVDVSAHKVALMRDGNPPVTEPGLDQLLATVLREKRLRVTTSPAEALEGAEVSMICVGTPSQPNGNLSTDNMDRVIEQVGAALAGRTDYHVVAIRSTMLPGLVASRVVPRLEAASGRRVGESLGLCVNPEFLRESTAIEDFRKPPFTIIGQMDERSGDTLARVYESLAAPVHRVAPDAAAMVKYACNAFHALKVSFANEIGSLCRELAIDGKKVMEIFCQDTHLNISKAYLRPGFAFGGSCLPKDLRALLYTARHQDVSLPVLGAVLPSNDLHIQRMVDLVVSLNRRRVALLGLSFKPGSDDLRESPLVRLAESLIGKGFQLRIYDEEVSLSNLFGRNREYIEAVLPHVQDLLQTDLGAVLDSADIVIVGKRLRDESQPISQIRPEQIVLDLTTSANWQRVAQFSVV
jgi:GDP-mannose 6-dehydrogenase